MAGDTSATISVPINNDSLYEGDEYFTVSLDSATNANISISPGTGTIQDNDAAPTVQFSSSTYSVNENAGPVTVTITKTGATELSATVAYSTSDGTATQPGDYTTTSGSVTFLPGETSKDITIPITNDTTFETSENFTVTLSSPSNATLGSPSSATVTIIDDDALPLVQFSATNYNVNEGAGTVTVTVTKTGNTALPSSVNYATSDGSATAGSDYTATSGTLTFQPNDTSKTFTVPITQDAIYEGNETFTVTLSVPVGCSLGAPSSATVTIVDDETPPSFSINSVSHSEGNSGTTSYVFTVTKTGSTTINATVDYATVDGTATAPSDYTAISTTTLTFLPGDTTKTITVLVNGDTTYEPDETFAVHLSNPTNATITTADGTGTIVNDDCYEPPGNMVAWWGGENNTNDIQGPTFETGTNTNGVTYTTGKVGQAFNFAGNNSISIGSPAALKLAGSVTIDAWVRPTTTALNGTLEGVVTKWAQNASAGATADSFSLWLQYSTTLSAWRVFSLVHLTNGSRAGSSRRHGPAQHFLARGHDL